MAAQSAACCGHLHRAAAQAADAVGPWDGCSTQAPRDHPCGHLGTRPGATAIIQRSCTCLQSHSQARGMGMGVAVRATCLEPPPSSHRPVSDLAQAVIRRSQQPTQGHCQSRACASAATSVAQTLSCHMPCLQRLRLVCLVCKALAPHHTGGSTAHILSCKTCPWYMSHSTPPQHTHHHPELVCGSPKGWGTNKGMERGHHSGMRFTTGHACLGPHPSKPHRATCRRAAQTLKPPKDRCGRWGAERPGCLQAVCIEKLSTMCKTDAVPHTTPGKKGASKLHCHAPHLWPPCAAFTCPIPRHHPTPTEVADCHAFPWYISRSR
jgi:hypothetical protein